MNNHKKKIYIIACCICIALLWGFLWFQYSYDRTQALAATKTTVSNLSKAFEENILGAITRLDEFLVTLRRDYPQREDQIATLINSYNRHSENNLIIQLSITDKAGIMIYNSKGMPDKPLDLSDREHFRVHLNGNYDKLFISKPVIGRVSKKWSIQFTRKILDRNGMFAGVAVLSVDPDYFSNFFRSIDVGDNGVITLMGMDGVIRARSSVASGGKDPVGMTIHGSISEIDPAKPAVGIYYAPSRIDGIARIASYRRLKNYPLVVRVALAEEEAFRSLLWHRNSMLIQGIFASGGFILAFGLIYGLYTRLFLYARKLEATNEELTQKTLELGETNEQLEIEVAQRQQSQEALVAKQAQLEALNITLQQRVDAAVAEIRQKDQVMIRQGRQASMGEMIGNIAHQWRQPLNALAMVLGNIKSAFQYNELVPEYLDKTIATGNRLLQKMSTTINDFSNFFRPDKESVSFSAQEQINQAISLVKSGLESQNISIDLDARQDVLLHGFPNEYSHVLLNLLSNSRDAINSFGVQAGIIRIKLYKRGDLGCIAISDNGGGIPEDVIDRVFEPYFSTKNMGSGIGLYMSKMIIERSMNGTIEVHNIEGGAEFLVVTPLEGRLVC